MSRAGGAAVSPLGQIAVFGAPSEQNRDDQEPIRVGEVSEATTSFGPTVATYATSGPSSAETLSCWGPRITFFSRKPGAGCGGTLSKKP